MRVDTCFMKKEVFLALETFTEGTDVEKTFVPNIYRGFSASHAAKPMLKKHQFTDVKKKHQTDVKKHHRCEKKKKTPNRCTKNTQPFCLPPFFCPLFLPPFSRSFFSRSPPPFFFFRPLFFCSPLSLSRPLSPPFFFATPFFFAPSPPLPKI